MLLYLYTPLRLGCPPPVLTATPLPLPFLPCSWDELIGTESKQSAEDESEVGVGVGGWVWVWVAPLWICPPARTLRSAPPHKQHACAGQPAWQLML